MHQIIAKNKMLFAGYLLFLLLSFTLLISVGKTQSHLILSEFHTSVIDKFFIVITWLGNGGFMVFAGLLLLFKKIRSGLVILSSFLFTTILVQVSKRFLFPDFKRPMSWFHERGLELYRIPGVEYHSAFSFPSGHSATAFALFFGLAFMIRNNYYKVLLLLLAVVTGYSRIFLSQHFLEDVVAGSILGICSAILMEKLFNKAVSDPMNKSLISLLKKKNV